MKKLLLIGLVVLAVAGSGAYLWYYKTHFLLTSSDPSNGGKVSSVHAITLKFNQALDTKATAGFSIDPAVAGSVNISGKQFIFTPTNCYQLGTTYTLRLSDPVSISGKHAKPAQLSFTATYIDTTKLPTADQQQAASQTDALENQQPIVQYLPHETIDYKIDYTVNTDNSLTLNVTLYAILNRPDQESSYQAQLKQFKSEALNYIKSIGFDPAKYKITYTPPVN